MKECFYKGSDGICARSTSTSYGKKVTDEICKGCVIQPTFLKNKTITDKRRLQIIIRESITLLEDNDPKEAMRILNKALKI